MIMIWTQMKYFVAHQKFNLQSSPGCLNFEDVLLTFIVRFQGLDPCLDYPCANNGTCVNNGDNTFKCICPSGVPGDRCQDREYFPYYKFHAEIVFVA